MDTLLKETVNATVNSRYPGMAPEGRKLIEDILIRKELEKGELLFKEGQVCHHMVLVGKGMMRQFYYKNGKDVTEHFSRSEDHTSELQSPILISYAVFCL